MGRQFIYLLTLLFSMGFSTAIAQESVEQLIADAQALSESGSLEDAHAILVKAVETDPQSSHAHTRLGGVELLQRDYKSGIKRFQQAIMLDRNNADAFVGLAVAYLHLGRYKRSSWVRRNSKISIKYWPGSIKDPDNPDTEPQST